MRDDHNLNCRKISESQIVKVAWQMMISNYNAFFRDAIFVKNNYQI